jgi:hypothetical protein
MFYLEVISSRDTHISNGNSLSKRILNLIIEVPVKEKDEFVFKEIGNMNNNVMYQ